MRLTLRPYQEDAIRQTIAALDRNPVLTMPTGAGKTVVGATIVERLGGRTLWLAHRRELITQAFGRLRSLGLYCGVISATHAEDRFAPVQVASVQTLARRLKPRVDRIVIDECHHAKADTYGDILAEYPGLPVIGLTATPFRLDGHGLGDIFGEIVVAAYTDELCAEGTLVEPIVYAPDLPDMSAAKMQHGDFNGRDAFRAMDGPKITGHIVETWLEHARGRRTVCFAVNVQHSQKIVEAFRDAGVPAEHLDGSLPGPERDRILARLASGQLSIVSNCMVLTEGWDLPALEVAIIARPTASLCLHLQQIGRIMRAADAKAGALVLDHAGNHLRHGFVTQRIEYSLDGVKRKRAAAGEAPLRRCRNCFLLVPLGAQACPDCGWVFRSDAEVPDVAGPGALKKFTGAERPDAPFAERAAFYAVCEAKRAAWGYKPAWSAVQYRNRFGVWPQVAGGRLVDPEHATVDQRREIYLQLVGVGRKKQVADPLKWAAGVFKGKFGVWPDWAWRKGA